MKRALLLSLLLSTAARADVFESAARADLATLKKSVTSTEAANRRNDAGESVLMAGIQSGDRKVVEFLLKQGADVNAADNTGRTPLLESISGGFEDLSALLMSKGAKLDGRYGEKQENLLFETIRLGSKSTLKRLIKARPALISERNLDGETPLFETVRAAQSECAKILLKAGARKDVVNKKNQKPADLANPMADRKILKILK